LSSAISGFFSPVVQQHHAWIGYSLRQGLLPAGPLSVLARGI
jgi:hypothetical protein